MKNLKKSNRLLAGLLLLGLAAALVALGAPALSGGTRSPAAATGTGPAVSGLNDNPGSSQPPAGPDRVTLAGKIDRLDGSGFDFLSGPYFKATDRVTVSVDQNTRLLDASGQALKLADLKPGQEIIVETGPVEILTFPAQVKAFSVKVTG